MVKRTCTNSSATSRVPHPVIKNVSIVTLMATFGQQEEIARHVVNLEFSDFIDGNLCRNICPPNSHPYHPSARRNASSSSVMSSTIGFYKHNSIIFALRQVSATWCGHLPLSYNPALNGTQDTALAIACIPALEEKERGEAHSPNPPE